MSTYALSSSPGTLTRAVWLTVGWFAAALAAAAAGVFATPSAPPIAITVAVVVPPALVVWRAARSERFREWARSLDLRFLTMLQVFRVGGITFVALASVEALPSGFALPAGFGDIAVGVTAPLVALYLVGRGQGWRRTYVAWAVFGIADLGMAVTLGLLHTDSAFGLLAGEIDTTMMGVLPMAMVAAFAVPFALCLHVLSLVNVAGNSRDSS